MSNFDELTSSLSSLEITTEDRELLLRTLLALDTHYALAQKMDLELSLQDIIQQLVGRIYRAYRSFTAIKGQHILDIACGSNTSKAPSFVYVNTLFGERQIPVPAKEGYTAQFEPWFCRILQELGAQPVGIDFGDLDQETFTHYHIDLGQPGALSFLPDRSFDAVHDSRLFGSPEFTAQFPKHADRLKIAQEIWKQEQRILKPNGIVIHSDAAALVR